MQDLCHLVLLGYASREKNCDPFVDALHSILYTVGTVYTVYSVGGAVHPGSPMCP